MKKVDQTIIGKGKGNCMQAVLASLFHTELEDAVNPMDYGNAWHIPMMEWIKKQGYSYEGIHNFCEDSIDETLRCLAKSPSVDGFWYGVVPSKTYADVSHAVIINEFGMVAHDPNPNKRWLGINVVRSKHLRYWWMFEKVK